MSKLSERNLKFETKQLHIGQETADGTTGATQKNVEQPADSAAPEAVDTLSAK